MTTADNLPGHVHVAIVHAPDGVRFATAAASRSALVSRLADYVLERSGDTLWAGDARRLRALHASGERSAAVDLYFARVGRRWDNEWLTITPAEDPHHAPVASAFTLFAELQP